MVPCQERVPVHKCANNVMGFIVSRGDPLGPTTGSSRMSNEAHLAEIHGISKVVILPFNYMGWIHLRDDDLGRTSHTDA